MSEVFDVAGVCDVRRRRPSPTVTDHGYRSNYRGRRDGGTDSKVYELADCKALVRQVCSMCGADKAFRARGYHLEVPPASSLLSLLYYSRA